MARFRKMRARARSFGKRYRKSGSSSGATNVFNLAIAGAIYGVARPHIEKVIPSQVSNFLGGYGDEALLLTGGYFLAKGKLGKNKMLKDAGKAIIVIESARIASGLTVGMMNKSGSSLGYNDNY